LGITPGNWDQYPIGFGYWNVPKSKAPAPEDETAVD